MTATFFSRWIPVVLLTFVTSLAGAVDWPARTIKIIVGGAPGSAPDLVARLIADRLGPKLGQAVVVENRPGAGGQIAMDVLVHSPPDGHTLALATMSQVVFNSHMFAKLSYDPLRDLEPIGTLVTGRWRSPSTRRSLLKRSLNSSILRKPGPRSCSSRCPGPDHRPMWSC
jgi:tripartite-type tricarboxylate transporter receptor subunit TctC